MKIALLTWEYPPRIIGGISRHCYGLAKALAKKGIEVHVFTPEFPGAPYEEADGQLHVHRVRVELGHPSFIVWTFLMNHFIEKRLGMEGLSSFDILHIHDWLTAPAGIAAKHLGKKVLVATIHSTEKRRSFGLTTPDSFLIDGIEWWATYEAKMVIVASHWMKREVVEHFKLPEEKVRVIPNGINPEDFKLQVDPGKVKMSIGLSPFDRIVLFIGRLTSQKGAEFLIRAFPKILSEEPAARLVIVGDGPLLDRLKALAHEVGIAHLSRFLGHIDNVVLKPILKSADVLVVPSIYEPFGIVALEGMASGVPVVASSVDGLREVVEHEVTGIHVYPGDPNSIAWGVLKVLKDEQLAKRIVDEARRRVEQRYSWDMVAEETRKVYEDALAH